MDHSNPKVVADIPDFPRIVSGCRLFEHQGYLILRSTRGAFAIEPQHRPVMERVLAMCDGGHDISSLLESENPTDAFYALRMLDWFTQSGLVVDGPDHSFIQEPRLCGTVVLLNGVSVVFSEGGQIATALRHCLAKLGASTDRGDIAAAVLSGAILIACHDGPNLSALEATNRAAIAAQASWLPVFPFGDAIVVGPLIRPGSTPCFRCLEMRWLGISPAIVLERAYMDSMRQGNWRSVSPSMESVDKIVSIIVSGLAQKLANCTEAGHSSEALLIQLDSWSVNISPVERHPYCDVCGFTTKNIKSNIKQRQDWLERALPLEEVARNLAPLATGRFGIVEVVPASRYTVHIQGLPEVSIARFAVPVPDDVADASQNWCHGSSERYEDAQTIAMVEAMERYAGLAPAAVCLSASYNMVTDRALLPDSLILFSPAQYASPGFPFRPFDPQQLIDWSEGYNFTRETSILIPSSATSYGQDDSLLSETSSGVAAHSSRWDALLNGALEVIERDAFMIHWLNRLSPPLIALDQIGDLSILALVDYIRKRGYELRIVDLTTDLGIPVYLALGFRNDREAPALVSGAGASLCPGKAIDRALREVYAALTSHTPLWTLKPAMTIEEVRSLDDHSRAYEHPDWLANAAFLWSSVRRNTIEPNSLPTGGLDDLTTLIEHLSLRGYDLIGIDITPSDIERYGLRVVRAIIPGLQPLGFGNRLRLGGRRLYEVPMRMGYFNVPTREDQLNRIPHCFP